MKQIINFGEIMLQVRASEYQWFPEANYFHMLEAKVKTTLVTFHKIKRSSDE